MASSSSSSYSTSLETTNYARVCRIVVDILRDILFLVLTHEILPSDLPNKVQINLNKLGRLDLDVKQWLCSISASSTNIPRAEDFDVSSLYTLIRNLCSQVPSPSTQWGQFPQASAITVGDDIERVREFRNRVYGHAKQAKIETLHFHKLFSDIRDVVSRFDAYFQSLGTPVKCDFVSEIDAIVTCSMDKVLQEDYIDKMKQIAVLSDGYADVEKKLGKLGHKLEAVSRNVRKIVQMPGKKKYDTKDLKKKIEEDIKIEMPLGKNMKIYIIKSYASLKKNLERCKIAAIAKGLWEENDMDKVEEIEQASSRRLCADRLLKRVLQENERGLVHFFVLLKTECLNVAEKLVEDEVTNSDRTNFEQVSDSLQMDLHKKQVFFQCELRDTPEKVDEIADVLLSKFHISIYDHSTIINNKNPERKLHALLDKIVSCHFGSILNLPSVLGPKLYDAWQNRQVPEHQGMWAWLLERINSAKEFLIEHFRGLKVRFIRALRGSLVLKFDTLDNFDVNILKTEYAKTKVLEMIKTVCPEYQDIFKEPIHLAIFLKPASNTGTAEVYFYLETCEEKEECPCLMKLGNRERHYIVEEMSPSSLNNWMLNKLQLTEDVKSKLIDLTSKDMSRKKMIKSLLSIAASLGDEYELLAKYCQEEDTFVYDKVFRKHRQITGEEKAEGTQWNKLSYKKEEALQILSCSWIEFIVESKGLIAEHGQVRLLDARDETTSKLPIPETRKQLMSFLDMQTKENLPMSEASGHFFSAWKNPSHSFEKPYMEYRSPLKERERKFFRRFGKRKHDGDPMRMLRTMRSMPMRDYCAMLDAIVHFEAMPATMHFEAMPDSNCASSLDEDDILGFQRLNISDSSLPPIRPDNTPTERQLGRITMNIRYNSGLLGSALGLSETDIQQIQQVCTDNATQCLMICFKWRNQSGNKATFRNLEMAFKQADIDADILSANKAVNVESCLPSDKQIRTPTDEQLNLISSMIKTEHVHLGVELEVPFSRIEQILTENLGDVHKQCFEIMKEWIQREHSEANFVILEKAFTCIGINPDILKRCL